ncbi:hypothetical protein FA13DRAFT_1416625 [Coprinellus micaceus]|uniref:Uncharacterized protein n=1 Tax=Coprinellus micaceus TaxID=71717 RepID=A0A4Y7SNG5_COPMI|nr:hypothetical protein FA13DRAFT_1416625 [Coprinellus micaceus]
MDISPPPPSSSHLPSSSSQLNNEDEELTRLRLLPQARSIPEVAKTVSHFLTLKRSPTHPQHFNDALMSTRAFRNPHLYKSLVEWAGVEEKEGQKKRGHIDFTSSSASGHAPLYQPSAPLYQPSGPTKRPLLNVGANGKMTRWG